MQGRTLILKDKNTSEFDKEMLHLQIREDRRRPNQGPLRKKKQKQNTN